MSAIHDSPGNGGTRLLLCGDLMTGRGIDQILPHPGDPRLHEPWVEDARTYVLLARERNGGVQRPVAFDYIWGDALAEFDRFTPDLRIANLETAITACDDHWPGKGIHYRMHPRNLPCLAAARIDACSLANNHVLDWGYPGLEDTLDRLARAGIATTGAGRTLKQAGQPARLQAGNATVWMFGLGVASSGIPSEWAAGEAVAGVRLVSEHNLSWLEAFAREVAACRQKDDIVIVSIHWGGNWGYGIPEWRRTLAQRLIDEAGVDIVHGHSSHHPLGLECYRGRLILYGCGDLINDYEGIRGHEAFRPDLALLYGVRFDARVHRLCELSMVPMQRYRLRLRRARRRDARWLAEQLDRESRRLGGRVELAAEDRLQLRWE